MLQLPIALLATVYSYMCYTIYIHRFFIYFPLALVEIIYPAEMEAFLGGHLEPFRRCLFRTQSSFLCSHISRAHRIGSSSMTFSLYSAQLFRYDGALSLNSTRESTVSQDDKFTHTQNSEDDVVGDDGQKVFSKDICLID